MSNSSYSKKYPHIDGKVRSKSFILYNGPERIEVELFSSYWGWKCEVDIITRDTYMDENGDTIGRIATDFTVLGDSPKDALMKAKIKYMEEKDPAFKKLNRRMAVLPEDDRSTTFEKTLNALKRIRRRTW